MTVDLLLFILVNSNSNSSLTPQEELSQQQHNSPVSPVVDQHHDDSGILEDRTPSPTNRQQPDRPSDESSLSPLVNESNPTAASAAEDPVPENSIPRSRSDDNFQSFGSFSRSRRTTTETSPRRARLPQPTLKQVSQEKNRLFDFGRPRTQEGPNLEGLHGKERQAVRNRYYAQKEKERQLDDQFKAYLRIEQIDYDKLSVFDRQRVFASFQATTAEVATARKKVTSYQRFETKKNDRAREHQELLAWLKEDLDYLSLNESRLVSHDIRAANTRRDHYQRSYPAGHFEIDLATNSATWVPIHFRHGHLDQYGIWRGKFIDDKQTYVYDINGRRQRVPPQ